MGRRVDSDIQRATMKNIVSTDCWADGQDLLTSVSAESTRFLRVSISKRASSSCSSTEFKKACLLGFQLESATIAMDWMTRFQRDIETCADVGGFREDWLKLLPLGIFLRVLVRVTCNSTSFRQAMGLMQHSAKMSKAGSKHSGTRSEKSR